VLTAFVIESNSALSADTSLITANALYHLSQQLHDPSVGALPNQPPPFEPASSDVRINALWFSSLVLSVSAALLAIIVKQWLREYMTWTTMASGKNTVALRTYRDLGWNKWHVRRWRDAIPTLLQTALLLFFWGLIEFLWGLQHTLAIVVSVLIGTALATFLILAFIPLVDAQCPYRSPFSWILLRAWRCTYQTGDFVLSSARIVLAALTAARLRSDWSDRAKSLSKCAQDYYRSLSSVSWDFLDLQHMDHLSWSNDLAMQATADVIMNCPSPDVLSRITAGIYESDGDRSRIPVRNLWYLLEGILGDDLASRETVVDKLKTSHIEELYGTSSLSKEFCLVIASLVRRTIRSQECSTEDVKLALCAVHLTSVLAHSEKSVFSYHTSTLAWLLHEEAPEELRKVAETNMTSLAQQVSSVAPSSSCLSDWPISGKQYQSPTCVLWFIYNADIVDFFKATAASLENQRTADVQLDVSFVALHIVSHQLAAINQSSDAIAALRGVLFATESWLGRGIVPTTASHHAGPLRLLHQKWCLLFLEIMKNTTWSSEQVSVVPASVVFALLRCLGRTPNSEWTSWTDTKLSAQRASVLADAVQAAIDKVYGRPAGTLLIPAPLQPTVSRGTSQPPGPRPPPARTWGRAKTRPMVEHQSGANPAV
jgi:hypothetical protein